MVAGTKRLSLATFVVALTIACTVLVAVHKSENRETFMLGGEMFPFHNVQLVGSENNEEIFPGCCGEISVPLPCCTSNACCDAFETEGLHGALELPIALSEFGMPLYVDSFSPSLRPIVSPLSFSDPR